MSAEYYGKEIVRLPPLSAAQEREMFRQYRKRRTAKRRDRIVSQYLYWAAEIANRYCGPRYGRKEAISAANLGLMQAIEKFDPKCGRSFLFMSFMNIRRTVIDAMRSSSYVVNPWPALDAAKYRHRRAGRTADSKATWRTEQQEIYAAVNHIGKIDDQQRAREPAPDTGQRDIEFRSDAEFIRSRLVVLTPQERKIIELRYLGADTPFFHQIGEQLDLEEDHVRYIHNRALQRLREAVLPEIE